MLKPLRQALADGDTVRAVIKGSSVNHGGRTTGYTVPNPKAHSALIEEAWRRSGAEPGSAGYIEAHGTGTSLGDPIEVRALGRVLGEGRDPDAPLLIGSVKTNIGHLESAAGVAGFIKVVLSLGEVKKHVRPSAQRLEMKKRVTVI